VVAAGVVFGTAATLRSNAIFNGLLLLEDALRALYDLRYGLSLTRVRRLGAAGLGGLCVGVGFLLPQYIAYVEYCAPSDIPFREWCNRTLPSIYTFVQDHYWYGSPSALNLVIVNLIRHVGLFRYWTLSNVPLFLLATPMLVIMVVSGMWALRSNTSHDPKPTKTKNSSTSQGTSADSVNILHNLAVSQLLLALLTFTTAHVQIITRISSACPVWVWFLAMPSGKGSSSSLVKNAVTVMALYGIIQGALFSSFLPPA
jgi:phosphatidylinositol glycan class V